MTKTKVIVDVYPIKADGLPPLTGWIVHAPEEDAAELGRKFAHRVRVKLGKRAIWSQSRLVTDMVQKADDLMVLLRKLWEEDDDVFKKMRSVGVDKAFSATARTQADFVAFGVAEDHRKEIRAILDAHQRRIRNATVERYDDIRGMVVEGQPALAISVNSKLFPARSLTDYIRDLVGKLNDLVGVEVKDKTGNLTGKITQIVGTMAEHRENLLARTTRNEMKAIIKNAPNEDLVLHVRTVSGKSYDYPASALQMIATTEQYRKLDINGQDALSNLQISSDPRREIVQQIARLFAELGYIEAEPFNSEVHEARFMLNLDSQLGIKARLGNNASCRCDPQAVLAALRKFPPYRRAADLGSSPLRLATLNLIGEHPQGKSYLGQIGKELAAIGFPVNFIGAARPDGKSHHALEIAVEKLALLNPHLIIAVLPGNPLDGEVADSLYHDLKAITLAHDLQSQFIYETTLRQNYAISNIVLGILAKTGTVPYVLDEPLPYTDLVVGIDIARERNERTAGSRNIAAMTRIYAANGDFLKYTFLDTLVQGEMLTQSELRRLLPSSEFAGKRTIIHRDGLYRGNEVANIKAWGDDIGAKFFPVEVVKSKVPRLYIEEYDRILRPQKGTAFVLNDREAFLVSSLPPTKNSTPRPLHVRSMGNLSIEEALHSVLAMTHLHYGSVPMPRLPVSLHYSDAIGYLVLRGVRPKSAGGHIPFWL
ncbi:MAG: hypothetical protein HS103_01525 [Anaerolineales bacterium]|nr:hypothetical protein [Anaerolineales bacterium]